MVRAEDALIRLRALASPADAVFLQGYFKTGEGRYAAGDLFLGIRMPVLRKLASELSSMPVTEVRALLYSGFHEARMLALLLLIHAYTTGSGSTKSEIFQLYLESTRYINNWDLVDVSAAHIVGAHLEHGNRALLDELAASDLLWERRIAIVATFHYIRKSDFGDTLRIARQLLKDRHDLIHKAVGWMLREVGKRDVGVLEQFLDAHARSMPRTALRYAIEKFSPERRRSYLATVA